MKKLLLIGAIWTWGLIIGAGIVVAVNKHNAANEPTVSELLALVNRERAKYGVAPLKIDPRLNASAQMKANDEVEYGYFGHMRGGQFVGQQFISSTGIHCVVDSENITQNTHKNIAEAAVSAWVASESHHKAMIDPGYTLTGFGIKNNQIVEHFCQAS